MICWLAKVLTNILKPSDIYDPKQKSRIELNISLPVVGHFCLQEQSKNVLYKYFFNNKEMVQFMQF